MVNKECIYCAQVFSNCFVNLKHICWTFYCNILIFKEKNYEKTKGCFRNIVVLNFKISQGNVATQLRWGGNLYHSYSEFPYEFIGERSLKNSQYSQKSWPQLRVDFLNTVYVDEDAWAKLFECTVWYFCWHFGLHWSLLIRLLAEEKNRALKVADFCCSV